MSRLVWKPRFFGKLLPDQRGNVAVIAAAAFPLLIGAAGLAVDGVHWVLQKREIQAATDAAAMAGVYGLIADGDMQNAVNSSLTKGGGVPDNAVYLDEDTAKIVGDKAVLPLQTLRGV